jgi:diaminopimelate epimerase
MASWCEAIVRYVKMNGAGNDFVVFDAHRGPAFTLTAEQARAVADRRTGVGCDQVVVLEPSKKADAFMRVWNADGGSAQLSGNGARCVAWLLLEDLRKDAVTIEIVSGLLKGARAGDRKVAMDMGPPRLGWREIPVARETDTVRMDYSTRGPGGEIFSGPGGVSMGNPHAVFFVEDAEAAPAAVVGPQVETDPFFPERVNVGFAQVIDPAHMRLRVWERGAGLTKACGTGACAAVVAGHRQGRCGRKVEVRVDGGLLEIEWRADGRVTLIGPVEIEGEGDWTS